MKRPPLFRRTVWFGIQNLGLLCLISGLFGCAEAALSPARYLRWVEQETHGLVQHAETPAFHYTLLFKPKPYFVLKTRPEAQTGRAAYLRAENEFDNLNYASLWLESADGVDLLQKGRPEPEERERRARYCSFDIQHDLALVEGADTLSCVFAHWERQGSINSRLHLILAFEKSRDPALRDKVFLFKNRLLTEETMRLTIPQKALEQLPTLAF